MFCLCTLINFFVLTLTLRHPWLKIIFLSQYLFIAILCAKISEVYRALKNQYISQQKSQVVVSTTHVVVLTYEYLVYTWGDGKPVLSNFISSITQNFSIFALKLGLFIVNVFFHMFQTLKLNCGNR